MAKGNRGGKNGSTTGYYVTVGTFEGAKIITPTKKGSYSLPMMSHSPNAIYILKNKRGQLKSLGIYNEKRELVKSFDLSHEHINYNKEGTIKEMLKKGIVHVHNYRGGRQNNVRYMTKKEKKKYKKYIIFMGGKLSE